MFAFGDVKFGPGVSHCSKNGKNSPILKGFMGSLPQIPKKN